jgi:hypothetical protein
MDFAALDHIKWMEINLQILDLIAACYIIKLIWRNDGVDNIILKSVCTIESMEFEIGNTGFKLHFL